MSSVGEAVKFFLNKNWVVFAVSLIGGFFTTILIPADWRSAIPLDNNDWKTIVLFVVVSAMFYVMFSGIIGLVKVLIAKKRKHDYRRIEQALRQKEMKDFLTASPDRFFFLIEYLIKNDNSWTYVYSGTEYESDYVMNTEWFVIEDAPEKRKVKDNDGKIHQEMFYIGRYKIKLHDWLYQELIDIKTKTGSLSHKHRGRDPYYWEIVKDDRKENKK